MVSVICILVRNQRGYTCRPSETEDKREKVGEEKLVADKDMSC